MAVTITFFAHGTTTDNERGIASGHQQCELSETGREQAEKLGTLVTEKFDQVFCSDLVRAKETAELAFGATQWIMADTRLREADYGDFSGQLAKTFKAQLADYVKRPFPHGESYHDVEKRIASFLEMLRQDFDGKHVAIVGHQATQLALDVVINKKTWQQAFAEDWRTTGNWQPGWTYRY